MAKLRSHRQLVASLDVGTSKTVALIAEVKTPQSLEIIGMGQAPSRGLRRGMVVNIQETTESIKAAIAEAEASAGASITEVYTGIAGSHVQSLNSNGTVKVRDNEVTEADIERAIEAAKALRIPSDQRILHVLTQEYSLDGHEDIHEPLHMSGVRLEVKVHIVTAAVAAIQNLTKCIRAAQVEPLNFILQPLASARAVLTDDEKELGVCLIDIGGGTTDLVVYSKGAVRHTAVIASAGEHITNDIALAFHTPISAAEHIKCEAGSVWMPFGGGGPDSVELPDAGGREAKRIPRTILADIIRPRVDELFEAIGHELDRSGTRGLLSTGLVITGGSSLMGGMVEHAQEVFGKPVRLGLPRISTELIDKQQAPRYATPMGLLAEAAEDFQMFLAQQNQPQSMKDYLGRMKSWFKGAF